MKTDELFKKIQTHMEWDKKSTELWFITPNPMLGNVSPLQMINMGRFEKLEKWVEAVIDENTPEVKENE